MKKRYKVFIGFMIAGLLLILVSLATKDRKVYYLSLGDSLAVGQTPYKTIQNGYSTYVKDYFLKHKKLEFYTNNFSQANYRSIDLLNDLKSNKTIMVNKREISIKNALIKADLVTLSIGSNDLFYKLNFGNNFSMQDDTDIYSYVDEAILDVDKLLYQLRKSCKEQIIVIGFYNPFINYSKSMATMAEPVVLYANEKLKEVTQKYNMTFINTHDEFLKNNNYLSNKMEVHPTNDGYRAIANLIIKSLDEKMLAK